MNLASLIKDLPRNNEITVSEFMDIVNTAIALIVETSIEEPIEINDWVIFKVDDMTFNVRHRYTHADMSRFLHDEFCTKELLRKVEIL